MKQKQGNHAKHHNFRIKLNKYFEVNRFLLLLFVTTPNLTSISNLLQQVIKFRDKEFDLNSENSQSNRKYNQYWALR